MDKNKVGQVGHEKSLGFGARNATGLKAHARELRACLAEQDAV